MRLHLSALLLSGVVVALSACSDTVTTSPLAAPQNAGLSRSSDQSGPNDTAEPSRTHKNGTYTFSIDPTRPNHLQFGSHWLDLPANSVCVADSSYSMDWDAPCTTSEARTTITVVVNETQGLPRVDLQPAIRFSPLTTVTLALYVKTIPEDATFSLLYCATSSGICVDESLQDATLAARFDPETQVLFRRIKHFSGYLVAERW